MTTTTTADAATEPREYTVLREQLEQLGAATERPSWAIVKTVKATSTDAAIKLAAADAEGHYVAVPSRSWQPRTLAVKTEKRTVLS